MMNFKSLFLLLTLAGLGVSCSNDDLDKDGGGLQLDGRSELQIVFKGTGESQEYTRAIATESEDKIDKLEIYLFAAASAAGPYYYLETWNEGIAFDPAAPTNTNFLKTASGTGWKASLYPSELKGLPYLKLMCIANNALTGTTDGKFYQEDGATEMLATLTKVTTDADGNNPAGTTEAEFKALYTKNLGADDATGRIQGSLLMTGEGKTKISGSVSKVDVVLKRAVSRFDIENTTAKSSLTIQTIRLAQGRRNGIFWGAEASENGATRTLVEKADLATSPLLTTYQPVTFTDLVGANQGLTTSALYVYPSLATDESYLIIDGTFKSPTTGLQVPVTYHVPIVRTAEGAPEGTPGEYIAIQANNRYKLRITDVTQSNILGIFEVVDWTSGGGIVVKPENDAPTFVGDEAFTGEMPFNLNEDNPVATTFDYEVGGGGTGSFKMQIGATGKVTARKAPLIVTRAGETDWLVIAQPTYEERDGVWYSTFAVSYANAKGMKPVAVTFLNEAAADDPDLQTTVNFYASLEAPVLSEATNAINSPGNWAKPSGLGCIVMKNSQIQFDVTCSEGVTVGSLADYGIEVTPPAAGQGNTYTLKIVNEALANGKLVDGAADVTVKFQNAKKPTLEKEITLSLREVVESSLALAEADGVLSGDAESGYTLEIPNDELHTMSKTLKVTVNTAPTIKDPSILESKEWVYLVDKGWQATYEEYTIKCNYNAATFAPRTVVFVDPVTKKELKLTLVCKEMAPVEVPVVIAGSNQGVGCSVDIEGRVVNLFDALNAYVELDIPYPADITFANLPACLKLTKPSGSSKTYRLSMQSLDLIGAPQSFYIQNAKDPTKQVALTLLTTGTNVPYIGVDLSSTNGAPGISFAGEDTSVDNHTTSEIDMSKSVTLAVDNTDLEYEFSIRSNLGMTQISETVTTTGWMTIKEKTPWNEGSSQATYTVTIKKDALKYEMCQFDYKDLVTGFTGTLLFVVYD